MPTFPNPSIPVLEQDHPILPPTATLAFVQRDFRLSPTGLQFLQQVYAALAGNPGLVNVVNQLAAGGVYNFVSAPIDGSTISAAKSERRMLLDPVGVLVALTVVLPPEPDDGDFFDLMTSQQITALTVTAGTATVNGGVFLFPQDSGTSWLYHAANTTWYRRYRP